MTTSRAKGLKQAESRNGPSNCASGGLPDRVRLLAIHPFGCILPAELNGRLSDVGDPHVFF